ncbi:uncharacterized protein B0J16DRAFT_400721 [Fusarium flagelliforme]|uniref:DUF7924 domain-containing protein n=1 Tax=Fusarium flagelliforme TaxID=2675880 RepID=A0A395N453_9HYPO|nr:uncharacterized protein B0J16DRAFT_400721 [Fusarium flagelliforme]KAH7182541.1 hypothetical protein B0J16DRAFT_400721 [Fusarium flagelliforme]RFN54700.1 hypothetical protein FIE12Z_1045 [Fusarium flagelliforme]
MDGPPEAAPNQPGPKNSKKRALSRSPSNSPSPSQAPPQKKTSYEQDNQAPNDHMMDEPTPVSEGLTVTNVLDYINSSRSSPPLTDLIDYWLEEAYPSEIHHQQYSRSDYSVQTIIQGPTRKHARSAPPIMTRHNPPTQGNRQVSSPGLTSAGAVPIETNSTPTTSPKSGVKSPITTGSLVEHAQYETIHLATNNIIYRDRRDNLPTYISMLIEKIASDRNSPGLSIEDVDADDALTALERGAGEPEVEQYIQYSLVTLPSRNDILKRSDKIPMARRMIPNTGTAYRVSGPVPDVLLGYNYGGAFTPLQRRKLASMDLASANNDGICLPFFVVEFKGDGPSSNEMLNKELLKTGVEEIIPIDTSCFSISMNGTEARLLVSWKEEQTFNVQKIRSFALQEADQFLQFRKCVLNIMDWGRNERLESIRSALDLLDENSLGASQKKRRGSNSKPKSSESSRNRSHPY